MKHEGAPILSPEFCVLYPAFMPFSTRIRVRFGDVDPAGLVYYPNIFHYFHIGLEEFIETTCGISYNRLIAEKQLGFPTVNSKAEFSTPLIYGDEVDLVVEVSSIGRSSATFEYTVKRASDGLVCASATQIHVCMSMETRRAVAIPDEYRLAFQKAG